MPAKTKQGIQNTFVYTWTEDMRSKGFSEIVSVVHHQIENSELSNIHTITLIADGEEDKIKIQLW